MASSGSALVATAKNDSNGLLTWAVSLFASAYLAWLGISLYYSTPIFLKMYASIGAELPLATRLLYSFRWFYPLLFLGAIAVVIAKQFNVREKWRNLAITFGVFAVMEALSNAMVHALYAPLLDLMEKLAK